MKQLKSLCMLGAVSLIVHICAAQPIRSKIKGTEIATKKKILNLFIIAKRKKGKFDLGTRYNIFRTRVKAIFKPGEFVSLVTPDAGTAVKKILKQVKKRNATIQTLWFDSHGMYIKGHSLFMLGKDEVSYKTISDSAISEALHKIAAFTDSNSKIIIGSCYGGATYHRLSVDYKEKTRMNGDSLMIALGSIFAKAKIYGSESWVMTKPGLFEKKCSVAGFPGRKLFLDICYQPAWENVGKWNEYNPAAGTFKQVNPVILDKNGSMHISAVKYSGNTVITAAIVKKLSKLGPGLYK